MESSMEPIKWANIFVSDIQMPEIDSEVSIFMLFCDRLIILSKSKKYYIHTYDITIFCDLNECNHDILSINGKKYLSTQDYKQNCSVDHLMSKNPKKVNYFMKIQNYDFESEIFLPNGIRIVFSEQQSGYLVKYYNGNKIITKIYVDKKYLEPDLCFTYYLEEPIMTKNARKN